MVRLYLPLFLALFILAVPKESVGQTGQLAVRPFIPHSSAKFLKLTIPAQ